MERTDWLDAGFDPAQARFLMVTAITHHRFSSQTWGEPEVRKLYAELAEIEVSVTGLLSPTPQGRHRKRDSASLKASRVLPRVEEGEYG
jgi:hypothetical protein